MGRTKYRQIGWKFFIVTVLVLLAINVAAGLVGCAANKTPVAAPAPIVIEPSDPLPSLEPEEAPQSAPEEPPVLYVSLPEGWQSAPESELDPAWIGAFLQKAYRAQMTVLDAASAPGTTPAEKAEAMREGIIENLPATASETVTSPSGLSASFSVKDDPPGTRAGLVTVRLLGPNADQAFAFICSWERSVNPSGAEAGCRYMTNDAKLIPAAAQ